MAVIYTHSYVALNNAEPSLPLANDIRDMMVYKLCGQHMGFMMSTMQAPIFKSNDA
jgi:hypothetical protein